MISADLIVARYARALHQLAEPAGMVDRVEDELDALGETVDHNEELRIHLASPQLTRDSKQRLLKGVLGEGVCDLVMRTVMLMTDRGRAHLVGGLASAYRQVAMAASGRLCARVQSAVPLETDSRRELVRRLEDLTGKTITLEQSVDPGLLGGVRIVLGSRMIDGSLQHRLQALGESLHRAPLAAGN